MKIWLIISWNRFFQIFRFSLNGVDNCGKSVKDVTFFVFCHFDVWNSTLSCVYKGFIERDFTNDLDVIRFAHFFDFLFIFPKNAYNFTTSRANESVHVKNHSSYFQFRFSAKIEFFTNVGKWYFLRCRNNQSLNIWPEFLILNQIYTLTKHICNCYMFIRCAWWCVYK